MEIEGAMKKKRFILFTLAFVILASITSEENNQFSYHFGVYDDIGFFSNYSGITFGVDYKIKAIKIGLNQKFTYGCRYYEVLGITDTRIYFQDKIFVNIGASYLLKESSKNIVKDFSSSVLPIIGFGCYIPIKRTNIKIVPIMQMNQSYYLTDEVKPIYSKLPFMIAMTVGIGIEIEL